MKKIEQTVEYFKRQPFGKKVLIISGDIVFLSMLPKKKKKGKSNMGLQKQFKKFDKEIYLSNKSDDYQDARTKEHSILSEIKKQFKEKGFSVIEDFRQGSFSTNTAIRKLRGDFDVDRAIVIRKCDSPSDPLECKQKVYDILENRGFRNHKIKTPCITADYASKNLHIDYAIYQKDDYGRYEIGLGKPSSNTENKKWELSEIKEFQNWINGSSNETGRRNLTNEEKAQFKRLVRYLKRWRDLKIPEANQKYFYSIGLTIMIKESFIPSIEDNSLENDLESLIQTVEYLLEQKNYFTTWGDNKYNIQVNIPFAPGVDVFRKHGKTQGTVFRNALKNLLEKLKKASDEGTLKKQCEILQGVFGDDFEIVDDLKVSNESHSIEKVVSASAGVVVPSQGA